MNQSRKIVVVGGVAGGASAAARARRCNEQADILLLEKDQYVSFANCGLPYYLGGEITDRNKLIVAKPERFRDWLNIQVRTRHQVLGIDRARKTVHVLERDTGKEYDESYDRLILSMGADPITPPIPGLQARNVFTLRNLMDTDSIMATLTAPGVKRAVVVGAGFIGLEMVEMLAHRGLEVALVELQNQVLPPLDQEMARLVEAELRKQNIQLHLGKGLASIHTDNDSARSVTLTDGTRIDCDLAIVGVGVKPSVKLAMDAGLTLGASGGIAVNEHMQTSDPAIFAVGDAAEYVHVVTNQSQRLPMAGPANRAGRVAGEFAATDQGPAMPKVAGTAIVRVFNVTAAATGLSQKVLGQKGIASVAVWVPGNHHAGYYPGAQEMVTKLIFDQATGKVLGAQIVGGAGVDKRADVIATVLHFGGTMDDLASLDLAYAPPFGSAKDPVHMAGFVAQNHVRGLDQLIPPAASQSLPTGTQVVDVRTKPEWDAGHLPGAIWIPLPELRRRWQELDPQKPVVTVCRGGQRSYYATRILKANGFKDVKTLSGGMLMQPHVK